MYRVLQVIKRELETLFRSTFSRTDPSLGHCSTCGGPITTQIMNGVMVSHNPQTCRLVNLAFEELGVSFGQTVRINVYPLPGQLRGYYHTADPYAIHVSEEAYSQFQEYIIFHETKHLVDCLTKGWSEEGTPDPFARTLCAKYGFRSPPAHQHFSFVGG